MVGPTSMTPHQRFTAWHLVCDTQIERNKAIMDSRELGRSGASGQDTMEDLHLEYGFRAEFVAIAGIAPDMLSRRLSESGEFKHWVFNGGQSWCVEGMHIEGAKKLHPEGWGRQFSIDAYGPCLRVKALGLTKSDEAKLKKVLRESTTAKQLLWENWSTKSRCGYELEQSSAGSRWVKRQIHQMFDSMPGPMVHSSR